MDELGVNMAGVEVIMRMAERMSSLQKRVEELEGELERLRKNAE